MTTVIESNSSSTNNDAAVDDFIAVLMEQTTAYTPNYCEENIYWLTVKFLNMLHEIRLKTHENLNIDGFAIFISNEQSSVSMINQKGGLNTCRNGFVYWDYHVIFLLRCNDQKKIYVIDYDTTLDVIMDANDYMRQSFPRDTLFTRFGPLFRIVPAKVFMDHFVSDRSHMLDANHHYIKTPPYYPPIVTAYKQPYLPLTEYISIKAPDPSEQDNNITMSDFANNPPLGVVATVTQFADFIL